MPARPLVCEKRKHGVNLTAKTVKCKQAAATNQATLVPKLLLLLLCNRMRLYS